MPAYYAPRYEEFLQQAIGTFAVRAGFTDVSDASRCKYLFAAVCRILDELSYGTTVQRSVWDLSLAQGADLESRATELTAGTITRLQGNAATGAVVFSTNNPGSTVLIATGTQVSARDGTVFRTTAPTTIEPTSAAQVAGHVTGQDSGPVPIVALNGGLAGNQAAGAISTLAQRPTGVDAVTNLVATRFGRDQESDDGLRARVRSYAASLSRSTPDAIIAAVLGAVDTTTGASIVNANIVESETTPGYSTLYIDDGSGQASTTTTATAENLTAGRPGPNGDSAGGGETRLPFANRPLDLQALPQLQSSVRGPLSYGTDFTVDPLTGQANFITPLVNGEKVLATYAYFTGLVALAQKIVDGNPADRINFPGYRAAGTRVAVATPQIVFLSWTGILDINTAFDAYTVQDAAVAAIVGYVNGLNIGEAAQVSSVIAAVMGVPGVLNFTLLSPTIDYVVSQTQLARTTPSQVTLS